MNPEIIDRLHGVSTATLTMQLLKRGLRNCFIVGARPLNPSACQFAAEAYTLRFIPMREDLSRVEILGDPEYPPRKAVEDIPPGAAMVIDARGEMGAGVIGDILAARMQERGVAAVVSDGPVRDGVAVAAGSLPVFCAGSAAPASLNVHFGADLQCPVACGGVAVMPGDVLVGDSDGVVVIPQAMAEEVARDGAEQERLENFLKKRVEAGHPTIGTYPPNGETLRAYEDWKSANPSDG
ncbi:MAG: ribonuclease activity regulator RraA [Alphaproteobacteria bacterium]|jgi:regulator of RNase E activity RraA|nr:ribonuclease activity regulator RraA [Alphaproteobacteria bacterium]